MYQFNRQTKRFLPQIMGVILLTGINGCTENNHTINPGSENIPILLNSNLSIDASTRTQNEEIAENQLLSFFVTEENNTANILYDNQKLTAISGGGFTYDQPMYYPVSGDKVDFYAIHPYSNAADLGSPLDFTVSGDQSDLNNFLNSDLLYSTVKSVSRTKQAVLLTFNHKLAKIEFTIKAGKGMDLATMNKVTVLNMAPSTSIDPANGNITPASGSKIDILSLGVRGTTGQENEVSGIEAIIVPQTVPQGQKLFKVTIGNVDYFYTPNTEMEFETGNKYHFVLTINQSSIEVSSTIMDWASGSPIAGEGEAED